MREAMEHLFARYRAIRPLFLADARSMNDEWNMRPYFGVFPRVFRALQLNKEGQPKRIQRHKGRSFNTYDNRQ